MAFNGGFPATYQQMYYPNQYSYGNPYMQNPQQTPQQQPQAMTRPTIHADIIQVEGESEVDNYVMNAGSPPQMFIKRDETEIYIKSILPNNTTEVKVYPLRPPQSQSQKIDMSLYLTKDEFEKRLEAVLADVQEQRRRAARKGDEE